MGAGTMVPEEEEDCTAYLAENGALQQMTTVHMTNETQCLRGFDTVHWALGRASSL